MKIEIRIRGAAIAALDDKGRPLRATTAAVRNYGRGNQVYLPKDWLGRKVLIVDVTDLGRG